MPVPCKQHTVPPPDQSSTDGCSWCTGYTHGDAVDPTGSDVQAAALSAIWQPMPNGHCSDDWTGAYADYTIKSLSDCQAACEASSLLELQVRLKSIVVSNLIITG